ncbi:MAG: transglycosylase SLT domain-containing protein, partial [Actinoallomurus sp.]
VTLWNRESKWNHKAHNPWSGAYGIPQALPGTKMLSAGRDWKSNPAAQIKWGLTYIKGRYKTPCGAWSHMRRTGWY